MKKIFCLILTAVILFTACSVYAEEPPLFLTFGEAVDAAAETVGEGEFTYGISGEECCVALIRQDGHFFRAVSFFDEYGHELYSAFMDVSDPENGQFAQEEYRKLNDYLMTLPVQYTEELTVVPFTQEDLDAMAGKTLAEVMSEPWELGMMNYPENADANGDVIFPMVKGFCQYELVINEPFEVYQERRARDPYDPVTVMSMKNYEDLTVRAVRYSGLSNNILNLSYQADGTRTDAAEPVFENYDLMIGITDILAGVWETGEPDQETKEAMIVKLTEEHPEAAEMIREIVESYRRRDD